MKKNYGYKTLTFKAVEVDRMDSFIDFMRSSKFPIKNRSDLVRVALNKFYSSSGFTE